jgi:hypothetical protein
VEFDFELAEPTFCTIPQVVCRPLPYIVHGPTPVSYCVHRVLEENAGQPLQHVGLAPESYSDADGC